MAKYQWIAALNFKKTFDSVGDASMSKALRVEDIEPGYIVLLEQLYHVQLVTAQYQLDKATHPDISCSISYYNTS